ncbi:MAG: maleylpyruvate isomerase family mycothiol-dependent enzyme [Ilumatobacteraceae bacterium]
MTATRVDTIPSITRTEAEGLARTEYARMASQLRLMAPHDWTTITDCPLWDVRAVVGHNVGMMKTFTGFRRLFGAMGAATRTAKRSGGQMIDALTAQQVADHADHSTDELIASVDEIGPRAARWRARAPWLFRKMPMKQEVGGTAETWRMGFLLDTILTRDPWMHRIDIAHATGRSLELTAEHDGRIVADAVAELARRYDKPFTLTLTGPAGGEFTAGDGSGDHVTIDAIELCRVLSGRPPANATPRSGLLATEVPF